MTGVQDAGSASGFSTLNSAPGTRTRRLFVFGGDRDRLRASARSSACRPAAWPRCDRPRRRPPSPRRPRPRAPMAAPFAPPSERAEDRADDRATADLRRGCCCPAPRLSRMIVSVLIGIRVPSASTSVLKRMPSLRGLLELAAAIHLHHRSDRRGAGGNRDAVADPDVARHARVDDDLRRARFRWTGAFRSAVRSPTRPEPRTLRTCFCGGSGARIGSAAARRDRGAGGSVGDRQRRGRRLLRRIARPAARQLRRRFVARDCAGG